MLNDFFRYLKKFVGVTLNKSLLIDIDKKLKKAIKYENSIQRYKRTLKMEKALTGYFKQEIEKAKKGRMSLLEFQMLQNIKDKNRQKETGKTMTQMKKEVKDIISKRDKISNNAYMTKIDISTDEAKYRKKLKERLWASTRLIRDDPTANKVYQYVLSTISSQVDGLKDDDIVTIKEQVEKRMFNDDRFRQSVEHQQGLLRASMDELSAQLSDSIGFIWETMDDDYVVGNPGGAYPKVYNPKTHGNHYERNNKIYIYRNCSALSKGYINTSSPSFHYAEFEDGRPGEAYSCRCLAIPIVSLIDLYDNDKSLISDKGLKYLKSLNLI